MSKVAQVHKSPTADDCDRYRKAIALALRDPRFVNNLSYVQGIFSVLQHMADNCEYLRSEETLPQLLIDIIDDDKD